MILDGPNTVALFDVLGFRNFVEKSARATLSTILDDLGGVLGASLPHEDVGARMFSDNIVLYGKSSERMNVELVTIASRNLLNLAARHGVALRGALSCGHTFVDTDRGIILGLPVVAAYELEQRQDWMGAVIDPKHADYIEGVLRNGPVSDCVMRYFAPMKSGPRVLHLCISWTSRLHGRDAINQAFRGASKTHDAHRKHKNTLEFFDYCESNGHHPR